MTRTPVVSPAIHRRNVLFAVAALLALGTGWLTFTYLAGLNRPGPALAEREVVVADRDIPARVTISPAMLATVQRPADAVDPDALAHPESAVGSIARVTIPAGSAVTRSKLARAIDVGLTQRLERGKRAIAIPVDRVKAVANLIQPGDHVDVIALTHAAPGTAPKALTILRNVVVLAMGSTYESTGATPAPDGFTSTATLEVTPQQAQLLALADVNTTLRLDLRKPDEPTGSRPPDHLVLSAPPALVTHTVAAPAAPRAVRRPPVGQPAVVVIDGDRVAGAR